MSDSYEDYPPARAFDDQMTTAEINEAIAIKYIAEGVSVAVLQARIAELEALINPAKWDGRLVLLPNYLKRLQMTIDFHSMSLRYELNDDLVQPWQFGVLHGDVLSQMFAAIGLQLQWSPERHAYDLVEL